MFQIVSVQHSIVEDWRMSDCPSCGKLYERYVHSEEEGEIEVSLCETCYFQQMADALESKYFRTCWNCKELLPIEEFEEQDDLCNCCYDFFDCDYEPLDHTLCKCCGMSFEMMTEEEYETHICPTCINQPRKRSTPLFLFPWVATRIIIRTGIAAFFPRK